MALSNVLPADQLRGLAARKAKSDEYKSVRNPLVEAALARGTGRKESRTKWIVEVNDLRKRVMHASKGQSLPVTEEQLAQLEDTYRWLEGQVGSQVQ